MTHVRLSHPWRWHKTRDLLELGVDLDEAEARHLIRAGFAVDLDDLIRPLGGGRFEVELSDGNTASVKGRAAVIRELRKVAGQ